MSPQSAAGRRRQTCVTHACREECAMQSKRHGRHHHGRAGQCSHASGLSNACTEAGLIQCPGGRWRVVGGKRNVGVRWWLRSCLHVQPTQCTHASAGRTCENLSSAPATLAPRVKGWNSSSPVMLPKPGPVSITWPLVCVQQGCGVRVCKQGCASKGVQQGCQRTATNHLQHREGSRTEGQAREEV